MVSLGFGAQDFGGEIPWFMAHTTIMERPPDVHLYEL